MYEKSGDAFILVYSVGSIDSWLRMVGEFENLKLKQKPVFIVGTLTNRYLFTDITPNESAVISETPLLVRKISHRQLLEFGIKNLTPTWECNVDDSSQITSIMEQIIHKIMSLGGLGRGSNTLKVSGRNRSVSMSASSNSDSTKDIVTDANPLRSIRQLRLAEKNT